MEPQKSAAPRGPGRSPAGNPAGGTGPGGADAASGEAGRAPVTVRTLLRMVREGTPFSCLTCYDATTARWLERAGIEVLLVGDTAAEMVLGFQSTLHAPLRFMVELTAGVKRGAPGCVVMADMPFMSYQAGEDRAVRNAGRFLVEGNADLVKLELDRTHAPLVDRLVRAGVPVVAHVGSRPQQAKLRGGYVAAGKTADAAEALLEDAAALEAAGASMLLVEACPLEVTEAIVKASGIPVIGCGAGPACHGQVVVLQDVLGMTEWQPAFAPPLGRVGAAIEQSARSWRDRVRRADLGEHPYAMPPAERERFLARRARPPRA